MSEAYTHHVLKVVVAQICQTIGWHSIQSLPLELMVDILDKYLKEITRSTHRYSELYGRTDPNLDDLGLAYKDLNVNLSDLQEYVQYVDPVPCAVDVPKYPVPKESHLNFLKPGSKEVLTRPVHIHEHLPPIDPIDEDEKPGSEIIEKQEDSNMSAEAAGGMDNPEDQSVQILFKKPNDFHSGDIFSPKRRNLFEEEGRPTREISSVMMTTSGFISPAREGRLPDSKAPIIIAEHKKSPPHVPNLSSALNVGSLDGKFDKKIKRKIGDKERKKDKVPKELFKPDKVTHSATATSVTDAQNLAQPLKQELPPLLSSNPVSSTPKASSNPAQPSFSEMSLNNTMLTTPFKKSPTKKKEKKKLLQSAEGGKSGEPKPKKQKMSKKMAKQMMPNQFGQQNPNNPLINQFLPPQYMDFLQGKSVPLNPQTNIMPVQTTFVENQMNMLKQLNTQFTPIPNTSAKLQSEPDKNKLNIFKKISKAKEPDPVIVIDDDDGPPPPMPLPMPKTKKQKHPAPEMPLNMSMGNKNISSSFNSFSSQESGMFNYSNPMQDFSPPKTPSTIPKTPDIKLQSSSSSSASWIGDMHKNEPHMTPGAFNFAGKEPKKRKTKTKEKKMKPLPWTEPGEIPPKPDLTKFLQQNMPSYLQQPGNPAAKNYLFNMFPFPSGPGLIPDQSLFQQFNPLQRPFNLQNIPNHGFGVNPLELNYLRYPPFNKPKQETNFEPEKAPKPAPIEVEKVTCNVAPLLPPSLKLDDPPNKLAFLESAQQPPHPHPPHPPPSSAPHHPQQQQHSPQKVSKIKVEEITPRKITESTTITSSSSSSFLFSKSDELQIIPHPKILPQHPPPLPPQQQQQQHPPPLPPQLQQQQQLQQIQQIQPHHPQQQQQPQPPTKPPVKKEPEQIRIIPETPPTASFIPDQNTQISPLEIASGSGSGSEKIKGEKRKDKEHKKEKKDKEGKIKKKKDKKDKMKSKEKVEMGDSPRKDKKDKKDKSEKEKIKREKKEKKREKERLAATALASEGSNIISLNSESKDQSDSSVGSVPKLTLKLGSASSDSPRPDTPDVNRKYAPSVFKHEDFHHSMSPLPTHMDQNQQHQIDFTHHHPHPREPSPELARISALVTRPPKQKSFTQKIKKEDESKPPALGISSPTPIVESKKQIVVASIPEIAPTTPIVLASNVRPSNPPPIVPPAGGSATTPGRGRPRIHPIGGAPPGPSDPNKLKTPNPSNKSPKEPKIKSNSTSMKDAEGNEVWICPACGRVDDGTPMIGCDGCDAWYHWVCVGIQVPPDANEDWYCRVCIGRKQESHGNEKKKKRKKKDKKDH